MKFLILTLATLSLTFAATAQTGQITELRPADESPLGYDPADNIRGTNDVNTGDNSHTVSQNPAQNPTQTPRKDYDTTEDELNRFFLSMAPQGVTLVFPSKNTDGSAGSIDIRDNATGIILAEGNFVSSIREDGEDITDISFSLSHDSSIEYTLSYQTSNYDVLWDKLQAKTTQANQIQYPHYQQTTLAPVPCEEGDFPFPCDAPMRPSN